MPSKLTHPPISRTPQTIQHIYHAKIFQIPPSLYQQKSYKNRAKLDIRRYICSIKTIFCKIILYTKTFNNPLKVFFFDPITIQTHLTQIIKVFLISKLFFNGYLKIIGAQNHYLFRFGVQ